MHDYQLLLNLSPADVNWVFDNSETIEIKTGDLLVKLNEPVKDLFFVQDGLFSGKYSISEDADLYHMGPGQVIGIESYISRSDSTVDIVALENSHVLKLPFSVIGERISKDNLFGMVFYYAVSSVLVGRLNQATQKVEKRGLDEIVTDTPDLQHLVSGMEVLKKAIFDANEAINKGKSEMLKEAEKQIRSAYKDLYKRMYDLLGDHSNLSDDLKAGIGLKIQHEFLPYILLTNFFNRAYNKPRGYAGDFLTIAHMYDAIPRGTSELGKLLDVISLEESPAAKAVQNRRHLLAREIGKTMQAKAGDVAHVTSMACGPAQELFDVYETLENPKRLNTQLVDVDLEALAFVSAKKEQFNKQLPMTFHHQNLVYLSLGRTQMNIPPQDLMYSIGLIDYFDDKWVVALMNYCYDRLADGGRLILGNFHPDNQSKAFQDYVLDWKLIHRDEEDMNRLYRSSKFGKDCTNIWFEEERINLFAECVK